MAINIEITELPVPLLEFGSPGEFTDPKSGLRDAGPFDLRFGAAHREQVKVGLVGPREMVEAAAAWFERCANPIHSGMANPVQYPSYPGFASAFHANLLLDDRWTVAFEGEPDELTKALEEKDAGRRFRKVRDLYASGVEKLADLEMARPDVVMCCIPEAVIAKCWSVRNELSEREKAAAEALKKQRDDGQLGLFDNQEVEETEEDLLFRDFRRALKARAMRVRMPIQLGTASLFTDDTSNQDPATRAWNSSVALYYKAGGIPWRLRADGPETCFVGVSFHHLRTTRRHLVMSSIAQAFSTEGEGFALRGESVPWHPRQGRNVHLTEEQAYRLAKDILDQYRDRTGGLPLRVVLHKSSAYDEAEREGFRAGLYDVPIVELINIMSTDFRLVRFGSYPPKRGTLCVINGDAAYLFTTGFMPEFGTYPGPHIPTPARVKSDEPLDLRRAAADILGLTRMNWNTAGITGGQPVTLSFSRIIGGIMAELGEDQRPLSSFRYYM